MRRESQLTLLIVSFIILAGTGLFYNFGLTITVDDEAPPLSAALKMIADHTLRPAYPTFYYMPMAAFAVLPFVLLGVLTLPLFGIPANVSAIKEFVILNFAQLLPWARLASVLYGALTVYLMYRIALRILTRKDTALLATFFFSTSLLFVDLAHFGKVWSVQLFAIMLTLYAVLRLFDEPTRRQYLFVAGGIALSFGINVIGVLVYVPFVIAHALKHKEESFVRTFFLHRNFLLAHACILALISLFYYLNPYGFENYVGFFRRFFSTLSDSSGAAAIVSGEHSRYCGVGLMDGLTYYFHILFEYELPMLTLAILGVLFCWRNILEKRNEAIILGSFAVVYFIGITVISAFGINPCTPRYILPVVPMLALLTTLAVTRAREHVRKSFSSAILFVVVLIALYGPVLFDLRLLLPSTRLEAREWILKNIPDGTRVITLEETMNLPENAETLHDIQTYAPYFLTKKREFLLDPSHGPYSGVHYYLFTPTYFQEGIPPSLLVKPYAYLIISWWNPAERSERLSQIEKLGHLGTLERIMRFPSTATDETESLDLPNNMRDPLFKLLSQKQNGPVIDIYQIRP